MRAWNETGPQHQLPPRNPGLIACYAVLAFLYRIFIMVCIMWFVMQVFEPYGCSQSHMFSFSCRSSDWWCYQ